MRRRLLQLYKTDVWTGNRCAVPTLVGSYRPVSAEAPEGIDPVR